VSTMKIDPGEVRIERSFRAEKSPRRRIDGQGLQKEFAKSRRSFDPRKVAGKLTISRKEGTHSHRISAYRGLRGQEF
jgi:hypothetical protein